MINQKSQSSHQSLRNPEARKGKAAKRNLKNGKKASQRKFRQPQNKLIFLTKTQSTNLLFPLNQRSFKDSTFVQLLKMNKKSSNRQNLSQLNHICYLRVFTKCKMYISLHLQNQSSKSVLLISFNQKLLKRKLKTQVLMKHIREVNIQSQIR